MSVWEQGTSFELVSSILDWVPFLCAMNQRRRLIAQAVCSTSFKIVTAVLHLHDLVVTGLTEFHSH